MVRLVTFDALGTIIRPRHPIHVQYSQVFAPYLGELPPDKVKTSFKSALKELQATRPAYAKGANAWWSDVIKRTALQAGADPKAVDESLDEIVPWLMKRFNSKEGYALYPDTIPTLKRLDEMNVHIALITNADKRIRDVLKDLGVWPYFSSNALISELQGFEKPDLRMFHAACRAASCFSSQALHIGDEYEADYLGAVKAGLEGLLLQRPEDEPTPGLSESVQVITGLSEIFDYMSNN